MTVDELSGAPVLLPRVAAVRYVTPLREGGSVPALVEADDGHYYVVKLHGAGQGARVLVAELIAGAAGPRAGPGGAGAGAGRPGRGDRAQRARSRDPGHPARQRGLNLGLRHLDGALTFDPGARQPVDGGVASRIVLLDAFAPTSIGRARNPNLLWWRGALAPIDHGAALYWQHDWDGAPAGARPDRGLSAGPRPRAVAVGRRPAGRGGGRDARLHDGRIDAITAAIPDAWLAPLAQAADPAAQRAAYAAWLRARRDALPALAEEAIRARAPRV